MRNVGKGVSLSASAIALGLLAMPQLAMAQDEAPETEDDENGGIPEIMVSVRKVEESLSDAPVVVSVTTADSIAQQGLNSLDDFAKQATGISFS